EINDARDLPRPIGSAGDIGAVEVQPGPAVQDSFVAPPTYLTAGAPFVLTLQALDAYGHAPAGESFTLASSDSQAVLPALLTFDSSGRVQQGVSIALNTPGLQTISVVPSDGSLSLIQASVLVLGA